MTFHVRKLWCINPADSPSLMDGFSSTQGYASLAYILWGVFNDFPSYRCQIPSLFRWEKNGKFREKSFTNISTLGLLWVEERKKNKSVYIYKVLCTKSRIVLEKDIRIEFLLEAIEV